MSIVEIKSISDYSVASDFNGVDFKTPPVYLSPDPSFHLSCGGGF
jgi:hypothetical protein